MARIMFVTPDYHCGVVESAGKWLNCGFVYMAKGLLDDGHEVKIYDAMSKDHRLARIKKEIELYRPEIVATSAYTSTMPAAAQLLEAAREVLPSVTTVIGGVHPSFMYEEVLQKYDFIDYVVREEGEETIRELVRALTGKGSISEVRGIAYRDGGGTLATPRRPFIEDLDTITGAWELVEWQDYTYFIFPGSRLAVISTSRGCKHDCQFCSQRKFWHQSWRARGVKSVTDEITLLWEKYNVDVILLADEYPTCDRVRWEAILDWLIEKRLGVKILLETRVDDIVRDADIMWKYKKAGVVHIYVGVEATNQETLDRFRKGIGTNDSKAALDIINSHDIITETSFVLGTPEENADTIKETLELAKLYNPDFAHFLLLAPWPYADMYTELEPYIENYNYDEYNLVAPIIKPVAMTRDKLFREVLRCYQEFYFYKLSEWRNLTDPFKRNYVLKSMKVILNNSFITQHIPMLGSMPKKVKNLINALKIS
ncbi:MAG TPA: cobalamin-dependent protein [Desulfobacteria bacterium]|nr:cobalamin-dependent protein [Desulfobacteria bacterium]